jgi:hypothetical protein
MEARDVLSEDVQNGSYEAPAVIYEAQMEVRAGTPVGVNPLDVIDPGK